MLFICPLKHMHSLYHSLDDNKPKNAPKFRSIFIKIFLNFSKFFHNISIKKLLKKYKKTKTKSSLKLTGHHLCNIIGVIAYPFKVTNDIQKNNACFCFTFSLVIPLNMIFSKLFFHDINGFFSLNNF